MCLQKVQAVFLWSYMWFGSDGAACDTVESSRVLLKAPGEACIEAGSACLD